MNHRYFYTLRPPNIGCQPDGWTGREGGLPKKDWQRSDGSTIKAFGWVEYPEPLSLEQVWKFDLSPDDIVERVHQVFYVKADRDEKLAEELELEWLRAMIVHLDTLDRLNAKNPETIRLVIESVKAGKIGQ